MKYALLSVFTIIMVGCGQVADMQPRVIIFGDSLAADPNGWAERFAAKLNMPSQNYAVGGTDFTKQIKAIRTVLIYPNDIVVFQPGINDAYNHGLDSVYYEQYKTMWREAISKFGPAQTVLLGTTSRIIDNTNMQSSTMNHYAQALRDVLAENHPANVTLVDTNSLYQPTWTNQADEVHPNSIGYAEISSLYFNSLPRN